MSHSAKDVQDAVGISRDRYGFLARKVPVPPDRGDAAGRGTVKRYSDAKVLEFACADRLNRLGLRTKAINDILKELRDLGRTVPVPSGFSIDLSGFFDLRREFPEDKKITIGFELLPDGIAPKVHLGKGGEDCLARFDVAVMLNLGKIRKEVKNALGV